MGFVGTAFATFGTITLFSLCPMQSNPFSKHKFLLLCLVFCGAMLAPSHDAEALALAIGDSHEVGFLWPGIQRKTANQDKAIYVNHLIDMAVGAIDVAN